MGGTLALMELLERQPHPTDGRQILYALTPEGPEAGKQVRLAQRDGLLAAVVGRLGDL